MTELATNSKPKIEAGAETSSAPSTAHTAEPPALITEQQVLFSTAASVALPAQTRRWRNAVHAVASALRAVFADSGKPPAKRHYPKRHVWLENSLMSREMDRL